MYLRPNNDSKELDPKIIEEKTMDAMKEFFGGKLKLSDIYTSEDYNSFYYTKKNNNKEFYVSSMSVHYKDLDNYDLPTECFYMSVTLRRVGSKNEYYYLDYYFDLEDEQLMRRILGKAARDATKFFNNWADCVELTDKKITVGEIKKRTFKDSRSEISKEMEERITKKLNENKRDYRYADFI